MNDPLAVALSIVNNAAATSASREELLRLLRGEAPVPGEVPHAVALFGEVPLVTLLGIAVRHDIPSATLARAYRGVRDRYGEHNDELEAWAGGLEGPPEYGARHPR